MIIKIIPLIVRLVKEKGIYKVGQIIVVKVKYIDNFYYIF